MTELRQRTPRIHNDAYLAWLRKQPCCVTGLPAPSDAAHVKSASHKHGKPSSGTAKPDDCFALPLSRSAHLQQHHRGDELAYWKEQGKDPFELCQKYYAKYVAEFGDTNVKKPRIRKIRKKHTSSRQIQSRGFDHGIKNKIPTRKFSTKGK